MRQQQPECSAAPLDEQFVVQADVVGVQADSAQEFEEVAGAEAAAEDLPVSECRSARTEAR
ncbi:hypothetical protein EDE04_0082 [Streptomyces sp. 2132.2]|uniref:hypothetical protein n=1 Tax=Streptomyces sp. 2132.2 TaxID=2485161 RepID=UPI000FBF09FC|nr:hypothetical protein [Streptomyces sp. 2132.2]ROQ93682.1 hypothetical protein EDE04_0082 [Streptomyces sp. 2132.2]